MMRSAPAQQLGFFGRVYLNGPPSFSELAHDLAQHAEDGGSIGDDGRAVRSYRWQARRMRRAEQMQRYQPTRFWHFMWTYGLKNIAAWAAVLVVGWHVVGSTIWRDGSDISVGSVAMFFLIAIGIGVTAALASRSSAIRDIAWASNFRTMFMEEQAMLLRPGGFDGWRLVKDGPQDWVLVQAPIDQP